MDSHQDELSRSTSPSPDPDPSPDNDGHCPDGDDYCPEEDDDDDNYFIDDDNFEEDDEEDEYNMDQEEDFFATPEIDSEELFVMEDLNDSIESEIIIWLFKFQQRFKIPDTALESLIKFLRTILVRFNKQQFDKFPTSLYKANKWLNFLEPKLQLDEEFPNNPTPSRRNQCNNSLSILKKNKGEVIAVPRMLYPKPSIRQQLSMLYQRPNFEKMLKSSGIQKENIYSDIYDGKVWKTFPFDGNPFFTTETAITHLGLLINLDWFQPFTYTQHSTGAIYASICNLPRSERNKPENIIYLGFLPGPKEVGLECINHYLAPIVDELLELWNGWKIPKTYECPDGLHIKVALIIGSSDTPATRKLFGHGGAAMKCYRCDKRSTYSHEYRKTHYGGMGDYDEWVTRPANVLSHRKHAKEWMECATKNIRDDHFKEHGVRWTELLRLPYMDPIRFAVVDPMHCLFLLILVEYLQKLQLERMDFPI